MEAQPGGHGFDGAQKAVQGDEFALLGAAEHLIEPDLARFGHGPLGGGGGVAHELDERGEGAQPGAPLDGHHGADPGRFGLPRLGVAHADAAGGILQIEIRSRRIRPGDEAVQPDRIRSDRIFWAELHHLAGPPQLGERGGRGGRGWPGRAPESVLKM